MSLNRVIRGSIWLYVSSIVFTFFGFIYWLMASRFVPSSVVGAAGSVIGIATIISSIFSLGISYGATRMFGRAWGDNDHQSLSKYFASITALCVAINVAVAIVILLMGTAFGFTQSEIPYIAVLIVLNALPLIPSALFNSTLKTEVIAMSLIISSLLRLVIGVALLYMGTGFLGVIMANVVSGVAQTVIYFAMIHGTVSLFRPAFQPAKESLKTGIPYWIPSVVSASGSWLGVISVNSISGAAQAGTYLMAFNISNIIYGIPLYLLGLMFPVLSGMKDNRKRATSNAVRLTSAVIAPLAAVLIAYPYVPLSLLGASYLSASGALQILMIGCFAYPISAGFNSLIYAYGKYRYVTILGLATTLPQFLLYFLLVGIWGNNGAALSYIIGLFVALVVVLLLSRRVGYSVGWGASLIFAAIPSALAVMLIFVHLFWVIGTVIIIAVSFFAYAKLGVVTRSDLTEVSTAFLSRKRLDSIYPYARYILNVLYGE